MIKPFSENIIFFDTEFTDLDPNRGEIISVGLVKLNGEELYLETEFNGEPSDWVKQNVLPLLKGQKISKEETVKRVKEFVGNTKPYILGYINQDDAIYWQKLYRSIGIEENVFNLVSIDFATILFISGINPENYSLGEKNGFFQKIGVDYKKYKKHNALDDAKILREVYLKLVDNPEDFFEKIK